MGIFSSIMDKIFHHGQAKAAPEPQTAVPTSPAPTPSAPQPVPAQSAPPAPVDVEAVLTEMASKAPGGGGNWRTSIVDLLKLLGLDSSLEARRQLAGELNVHAGADGSAEQNIALHKAVMKALADNGGVVPASLRD